MAGEPKRYQQFFAELKRRHVFKVAAVYGAVAFVVMQAGDFLIPALQLPETFASGIALLLLLGFPIALVLAWAYEMTPEGVQRTDPATSGQLAEIVAQPRASRWPAGMAALAGVLLLLGGGWWALGRGTSIDPFTVEDSESAVAVLPFRATGEELAVWREGLMDLLAANLDGVGNLRAVDTRAMMSHWRNRFGEDDPSAEAAVALAGDLGARWAVHGQAVALGGQVRLDARVYDAENGDQVASTTVAGPPDSILGLTEGMTLSLLRELGSGRDVGDHGRAFTSRSLDAVRAYLQGVQATRRSDWEPAIESLKRALELDSTFAMAAARLSEAYGWRYFAGHPLAVEAGQHAMRFADRLPPRDRDMLALDIRFDQGRAVEALDLAQRLTSRYPTDPEAWYKLGEVHFHLGYVLGTPLREWREPFDRALALDSAFLGPMMHLMDVTQRLGEFDDFARYAELYFQYDSTSREARSRRRVLDIIRGTPEDSLAALASLADADYEELRQTALASFVEPALAPTFSRVVYEMTAPRHPVRQRETGWRFWVNLTEIWRGRPAAADAALDSAAALGINPGSTARYRLANHAHGFGKPAKTAEAIAVGYETGLFNSPLGRWALGSYYLYEGQLPTARASADTLQLIADSLSAAGDSIPAIRARGLADGLRGLLAARRGRFEEAVSILRRAIPRSSDLGQWLTGNDMRFTLGVALAELGRDAEAIDVLDGGLKGAAYVDAPTFLLLGQLHERRGEREPAIRAYSRVVELWRDCEPELVEQRQIAERGLDRLLAEGRPRTG
ncbi:MAG: tetratricopeptide repeat protein [Gemmatimonadetes bacterium]|uniref:Tetratricopeptide repeat protein n=1 Tax=Candidatus Kutchimonas denitrificans TaxID=3056748 RepID=A0AAE4Z6Y4_9BACT|nr:tetratricopeptide repeat protein [Gemmatimonadota bacterium]NIR73597.1 tetratricopeptide repeat protein [Candidatus Kutchimonas denitrificans]NIR99556.1 tetratricopeptide repeat protein [Gemmatimonadota bacterium]NIT65176.1 tetratricopeptide repeat protein [Gemmatimonadota bacterium]NIV23709.1 tetratricopeptide repeat protein [Gemmatimonadota bacterium]